MRGRWLDDFAKDLTYALRTLLRNPGFSLVAILSFALGIGANAAIFSLINGVMLRTLPVHEPARLVQITRLLNGRPARYRIRSSRSSATTSRPSRAPSRSSPPR